jgi:intracellular septation protein
MATITIICCTIITSLASFFVNKKIAIIPLISAILITIFGGITVLTGDTTFIKIKPTVINLLFAVILLIGVFLKKGLLKHIMGSSLVLSDEEWIKFSFRWAMFFLTLACLNEIVWRNFSEETWVKFKVFGIISLTIIFMLSQLSSLTKKDK